MEADPYIIAGTVRWSTLFVHVSQAQPGEAGEGTIGSSEELRQCYYRTPERGGRHD